MCNLRNCLRKYRYTSWFYLNRGENCAWCCVVRGGNRFQFARTRRLLILQLNKVVVHRISRRSPCTSNRKPRYSLRFRIVSVRSYHNSPRTSSYLPSFSFLFFFFSFSSSLRIVVATLCASYCNLILVESRLRRKIKCIRACIFHIFLSSR